MKKLIIAGAFVITGLAAAQAQTAPTTGQDAPHKNGRSATEAPRVSTNDPAGLTITPPSTTTGTRPATTSQTNELQPASTPNKVIDPNNRVNVSGSAPAPAQAQPVKKVDTTPAPKN